MIDKGYPSGRTTVVWTMAYVYTGTRVANRNTALVAEMSRGRMYVIGACGFDEGCDTADLGGFERCGLAGATY